MLNKIFKKIIRTIYKISILGQTTGPHITRYYLYKHLSKYHESRQKNLKVLSISHSEGLAKRLGFDDNQITDASYPEYNILDLPFKDNEFDVVVSDQVLEHVRGNPQQAVDEVFRILKPEGISLHTTCFINPIHGLPNDYWRYTPAALELMTEKHAKVIDVGGWGNEYVWLFASLGLRFQPITNAKWHPAHWLATKNNPKWPIITWILSTKN